MRNREARQNREKENREESARDRPERRIMRARTALRVSAVWLMVRV